MRRCEWHFNSKGASDWVGLVSPSAQHLAISPSEDTGPASAIEAGEPRQKPLWKKLKRDSTVVNLASPAKTAAPRNRTFHRRGSGLPLARQGRSSLPVMAGHELRCATLAPEVPPQEGRIWWKREKPQRRERRGLRGGSYLACVSINSGARANCVLNAIWVLLNGVAAVWTAINARA